MLLRYVRCGLGESLRGSAGMTGRGGFGEGDLDGEFRFYSTRDRQGKKHGRFDGHKHGERANASRTLMRIVRRSAMSRIARAICGQLDPLLKPVRQGMGMSDSGLEAKKAEVHENRQNTYDLPQVRHQKP
jgi:hypothetical protein